MTLEEVKAKTVIVGDAGVGKTCTAKRAFSGQFDQFTEPTMGSDFHEGIIETATRKFRFEIWDTAGQEVYRSLAPVFFKDAVIAILMYDVTKPSTLETLDEFYNVIQDRAPNCFCAVVGNKIDLPRAVPTEQGREYAQKIGATLFMETSAVTGEGVDELFVALANEPNLKFTKKTGVELPSETGSGKRNRQCNC